MVMTKMLRGLLLLGCFFASVQLALADSATASLDRSITTVGESVLLSIHVHGSADQDPDLSVLKKDFEILNQSQSSSYNYRDGHMNKSVAWQLNLMPKHLGTLTIPAISMGNMATQALSLRVLDRQVSAANSDADVFLEVTLDTEKVYVQAQLVLQVKLFRAVNLAQAQLSEPDIAHVTMKRMGKDHNYETVRDQRRFVVTERKYAIFPQQSGLLHIPALQFTGQLVNTVGMFNQGGRVVRVQSKALDITVLAMPNIWKASNPWLPASNVTIREIQSNEPSSLKLGEPLTRTIEIRAEGLTAEQLPQLLNDSSSIGFKQYPDKPVLTTELGAHGVIGVRREKIAMIPTKSGDLMLPEISVSWWDTATHEIHKAQVLGRVVTVAGAVNAQVAKPAVSASMVKNKPVLESSKGIQGQQKSQQQAAPLDNHDMQLKLLWWQIAAIFFALLWLLTLLYGWYIQGRKKVRDVPQTSASVHRLKSARQGLKKACQSGDAKHVAAALPVWGACFFDDESLLHFTQLKGHDDSLDQALCALEAVLYSPVGKDKSWQAEALLQLIDRLEQPSKTVPSQGLKALYE